MGQLSIFHRLLDDGLGHGGCISWDQRRSTYPDKTAAIEYAKDGIRINSVHPGGVDTVMLDVLNREGKQAATAAHPLGRLATAEDIAYGVLYLASDEASFVTGAELVIDGGYTAQ